MINVSAQAREVSLSTLPQGKTIDDITLEEGIAAFDKAVEIRDSMGGAMYFNMFNEQVTVLYDVCRELGASEDQKESMRKHARDYI